MRSAVISSACALGSFFSAAAGRAAATIAEPGASRGATTLRTGTTEPSLPEGRQQMVALLAIAVRSIARIMNEHVDGPAEIRPLSLPSPATDWWPRAEWLCSRGG